MQRTGISTLVAITISCIAFASALSLEAPERAMVDENVSVKIREASETTMDVKLFVEQNETIISQIYTENGWKNSFYYLPAAFPAQKKFLIRVRTPAPDALLCARLRQTGTQKYEESCQTIVVEALRDANATATPNEKLLESAPQSIIVLQNSRNTEPETLKTREYFVQRAIVIVTLATTVLTLLMLAALFLRERMRRASGEQRI